MRDVNVEIKQEEVVLKIILSLDLDFLKDYFESNVQLLTKVSVPRKTVVSIVMAMHRILKWLLAVRSPSE